MVCSESGIVSRIKISGDDQPKNLAILSQQGYEVYFIETTIKNELEGGTQPYFYYEALRDNERLHAVTPSALLQLVQEQSVDVEN